MQALIIADRPELSRLLATAAATLDFAPVVISDAAAAVRAFSDERHPLVLVDHRIGEVDGVSVCRQLRQYDVEQRSVVLIVTARSSTSELQSLIEQGIDDYLLEPLEQDLLQLRLKIAARRAKSRAKSIDLEQQLRNSVQRFKLAVTGANDGLWDAEPMGQPWQEPNAKVWYSPRFKELLGFRDDEFPNVLKSWESRLHPDDRERVFAALAEHIDHRHAYDVEYRLRIKSGEYRWFSARGQGIWNDQGQLWRMSGSLRDITHSKQDEAKLAQSEARWRSLVENAPDIIILTDPDGILQFVNRDTEQARLAIGRTVYDYIREPFWQQTQTALAALRATNQPQEFELRAHQQGGGTAWYSTRFGPILHDERLESVIIVATDITHRKLAEERVEREREVLRRLLDLQERERQLVAYEIHDGLVQYLTGGIMHLEAADISGKGKATRTQAEYDRGLGLLRDALVEARRLISGLRPPILDEQGVVAALEYLANEARPEIPGIEFINRYHFGRLAAPLEVAIFRITQEALSNIRQHSGSQRARVELIQHGEWVRLTIRDWGCGFNPQTVHEERFGLQGIRQRAQLLGTTAVIESAPGQGTSITIDFPLVAQQSDEE